MIEVDIVTPTKRLVAGVKANSLKLPSSKGELQILPGHAELLTLLGTGILSFAQDGAERKFAVSYGFAEVRRDKVLVLAETCEESSDIDLVRAKAAKKKSEEVLSASLTPENFKKYQLKLQRAIVRNQVAE